MGAAHIKSTFTHGRTTWVRLLVGVAHIKASSHTWKNNVGPIVSGHCTIDTIARPSRQKSQNTLNFILCNKYIQHNENNHFTYCKYFRIDLKIMTSRIYTTIWQTHKKQRTIQDSTNRRPVHVQGTSLSKKYHGHERGPTLPPTYLHCLLRLQNHTY